MGNFKYDDFLENELTFILMMIGLDCLGRLISQKTHEA